MKQLLISMFKNVIEPIMKSRKNYEKKTFDKGKKVTFYSLDVTDLEAIENAYQELKTASEDYPDVTVTLKRGEDDFGKAKASTYKDKDGNVFVNKTTVLELWENTKEDFNPDML